MTDNPLNRPLKIGSLEIRNRAILAPLARVSDVPYRRICQEMNAGLTYIEMLSAKAVLLSKEREIDTLSRHESEDILGIQITGKTPEEMARACRFLEEEGYDAIDINMGCPVKKVVGKGWGSALLLEPEKVSATAAQCRAEVHRIPFSIKIRIGYNGHSVNVQDNASRIAAEGVDMLTIHGRTRAERYDVPCDLRAIRSGFDAALQAAESPPVLVGNGDVMGHKAALKMVKETSCDAVMISRGALGNPWIFNEVLGLEDGKPTIKEWMEVLFRHLEYHRAFHGDNHHGNVTFRKHLLWYATGFPGIRQMRNVFGTLPDLDAVIDEVKRFAARLPADIKRFDDPDPEVIQQMQASYDPKFDMDREADRVKLD